MLKLSSTLEDYLQVIFRFQQKKQFARVSDVASALKVARSAVTAALHSLSEKGLVNYQPYEPVTLSAKGRERAEQIVLRHRIIADFLENVLAIPKEQAQSAACRMEHSVDAKILDRFICFLAFIGRPRKKGISWRKEFHRFMKKGTATRTCKYCVDEYLRGLEQETKS